MYKNKENYNSYMKEYMKEKRNKEKNYKTVEEQRMEAIGTLADHCIDESIYDPDCPKYRSDKTEYTKQEVEDNFKWVQQYIKKIERI